MITDKFVFIHVPKVAGTSIQYALTDSINYKHPLHKGRDRRYPGHITYAQLANRTDVSNLFSFAFVRNPWDWARSLYHYIIKHGQGRRWANHIQRFQSQGLNTWINKEMMLWIKNYTPWPKNQSDWVDGISFIGRYENLEEDFAKVCDRLEIECTLRHKLKSTTGNYADEYNESGRKAVQKIFNHDIETFGYTFK